MKILNNYVNKYYLFKVLFCKAGKLNDFEILNTTFDGFSKNKFGLCICLFDILNLS